MGDFVPTADSARERRATRVGLALFRVWAGLAATVERRSNGVRLGSSCRGIVSPDSLARKVIQLAVIWVVAGVPGFAQTWRVGIPVRADFPRHLAQIATQIIE
jgi:hypothetical protein